MGTYKRRLRSSANLTLTKRGKTAALKDGAGRRRHGRLKSSVCQILAGKKKGKKSLEGEGRGTNKTLTLGPLRRRGRLSVRVQGKPSRAEKKDPLQGSRGQKKPQKKKGADIEKLCSQ